MYHPFKFLAIKKTFDWVTFLLFVTQLIEVSYSNKTPSNEDLVMHIRNRMLLLLYKYAMSFYQRPPGQIFFVEVGL